MDEQWRCPICETLNTGTTCNVCGTTRYKAEEIVGQDGTDKTGELKKDDILFQDGSYAYEETNDDNRKNGRKIVWISVIIGILLLFGAVTAVVLFMFPVHEYEKFAYRIYTGFMSDSEKEDYYFEKGTSALSKEAFDEAEYYLRDKVLEIDNENSDAWAALLQLDRLQDNKEAMIQDISDSMEYVKNPGTVLAGEIDAYAAEQFIIARDSFIELAETCDEEKIPDNIKAEFEKLLSSSEPYEEYIAQTDMTALKNAKKAAYVEIYNQLSNKNDSYQLFFIEKMTEAVKEYPDSDQLVLTITEYYKGKITVLLSNHHFEKAYELCESLKPVDNETYESLLIDISQKDIDNALQKGDTDRAYSACERLLAINDNIYTKEKTKVNEWAKKQSYLKKVKKLFDKESYSELQKYMDGKYDESTLMYQEKAYVENIASGTGMIVTFYGVYVGSIENGQRSGYGKQVIFIDDNRYEVYEGDWSDNYPNGYGIHVWWSSNGTKSTITGNFVDGYENGTMTITWINKRNWTATYTVNMGTLTSGSKSGEKYIYAVANASDGASAWWSTSNLNRFYIPYFIK